MTKDLSFLLTHLGEERENYFQAVTPPIIQSSNFCYPSVEAFRAVTKDEYQHPLYTRGANPTVALLRQKVAALEGSEAALAFSSGSAAVAAALIGNVQKGDHVICVEKPYSWTYKLLSQFLSRFGVEHTFVDTRSLDEIRAHIRPNTKVLMLESPNSLTFELQDLAACAKLAKEKGITTIVDNSCATPLYQNPIALGIDIVVHSGTKYLCGHSDVVWGVVCCTEAMARKIFYSEYMTLGANLSPHDAWLVLRGLRTLPLRLQKSTENALALAAWLEKQPLVEKVYYPFLPSFGQYELAKKQMRGGGGLFSVVFKSASPAHMERFCNALTDTFLMAVSWGGYESLQIPTCVFYQEGLPQPSLPFNFVRFYAGLEEFEFLKNGLERAMKELF